MTVRREALFVGLLVAALGASAGVGELSDNSFFTHLATGRLIFDSGFPRTDPYTFTAYGDAWFPQSWLASVLYAGLEDLGGAAALRIGFGVSTGVLAALGWLLSASAGTTFRRAIAVGPFLAIGVFSWTQRPYLLALACLAAVLLVAQDRLDRRWLLLAGWVWLNVHGSWPLGLAAAVTLWIGRRLDREPANAERTAFAWLAGGLALGCLNPYGPRLLAFPLVAVERRDDFALVTEWKPPTFDRLGELAFLGAIVVALAAIRLRPSWRAVVPVACFTVAGLLSTRNIQVAAFVFVPVVADCLRGGTWRVPALLVRATPVLAAGVAVLSLVVAVQDPGSDESDYPVAAREFLEEEGLEPIGDNHVIAQDFVGNWFELRYGDEARVFLDDRFELASSELLDDYLELLRGRAGWEDVLRKYEADAVVWAVDQPLTSLLDESECWDLPYRDDDYVVAVPADC